MANLCTNCCKPLNDWGSAVDLDYVFCSDKCQEEFDKKEEKNETP